MSDVTDAGRTTDEQGKIVLLSLWMLDTEFRNFSNKKRWGDRLSREVHKDSADEVELSGNLANFVSKIV